MGVVVGGPGGRCTWGTCLIVYQAELCLPLPGVNFLPLPAPCPCVPMAPAHPSSPFSCFHARPCPAVDGKWQAWASWGSCSVTCGGGTQRRERACLGPFFGGVACQGPQDEYRQCGAQRCPGECLYPTPQLDPEAGEALGVQLGDDRFVRVDVPWRLGPPDPAASSLPLPAFPLPCPDSCLWPLAEPHEICDEDNFGAVVWKETPAGEVAAVRCPRNATGEGRGGRGWQGTCPFLVGCAGGTEMPLEACLRAVSTGHMAQTPPGQPRAHQGWRGAGRDTGLPCPKSAEPVPA